MIEVPPLSRNKIDGLISEIVNAIDRYGFKQYDLGNLEIISALGEVLINTGSDEFSPEFTKQFLESFIKKVDLISKEISPETVH